jgi:SAM-dependent methyltransferase
MRQITFHSCFDRVMLLFTSFGYFEDHENLLVLQNAARALRPGGLFIMDSMNRDTAAKNLFPSFVTDKEGDLMIDRNSFEILTGRWHNRRIIIRNGLRRDLPFSIRLYNPSEMHALLHQAGLELISFYGGFDGQPLSADSRRLVVLARTPA